MLQLMGSVNVNDQYTYTWTPNVGNNTSSMILYRYWTGTFQT